jgi:hypothetical protein
MKAARIVPTEGKLPEYPLTIQDPPDVLPEITQTGISEFGNALYIFRMARADFEAKRAALTMKLLRCCRCKESDYFVSLDEHDNLVLEDHTSLEPITNRPIVNRDYIPSGGAA